MKAYVVVGAVLGDEGKGLMVDYLASRTTDAVVVRASGGAQAAHTVQINGDRTVFHHLGSGTHAGASTYLGREFIVNPIMFAIEQNAINAQGVMCHPMSKVTTPYDMMHNQVLEMSRGSKKHGSCGLGINATVDRHEAIPFCASQLANPLVIQLILDDAYEYVKASVLDKKLFGSFTPNKKLLDERFIEDCLYFASQVDIFSSNNLTDKDIIFEMAQGLMLDEHHKWFPYVTRSRTGLDNVIAMLPYFPNITELEVIYMTRAYAVRHGEGPFPTEKLGMYFEDETNVVNRWQGGLRFGHLDVDLLLETTNKDFAKLEGSEVKATKTLCVTCIDQMKEGVTYKINRSFTTREDPQDFLRDMTSLWDGKLMFSNGPERTNVHDCTR